jgi:hypothetical protein
MIPTINYSGIPSINYTSNREALNQARQEYEYKLQQLAFITTSDDYKGVRESLVEEVKTRNENDYLQATTNNLQSDKITTVKAAELLRNYEPYGPSVGSVLEEEAVETVMGLAMADSPTLHNKYKNNPELFAKDKNALTNHLLLDKLYDDYQVEWNKNPGKLLKQAAAETVTSVALSWWNFGILSEGGKQVYKANKLKDVLNVDDSKITPAGLANNLRNVIFEKIRNNTPAEFEEWITNTLKPAIDDMPMIYQQELLEFTLQGYQPIDNLFLVSDIIDLGRGAKAMLKGSKADVSKTIGDMSKALDDIDTRKQEALSTVVKPDVTDTTTAQNNKVVKKEIVKNVTENEATELGVVDGSIDKQLLEAKNIEDITIDSGSSFVDYKDLSDVGSALIGHVDGTPYATYEEALEAANKLTIDTLGGVNIDNLNLLRYDMEPVKINGQWYVRKINGRGNYIVIKGL